jgi:hypothetical protein
MSMYKELGNVEGSRLPMTLVPVLAVSARVRPCAFPVSLKATAVPHPFNTYLCLITNSRLTTTTLRRAHSTADQASSALRRRDTTPATKLRQLACDTTCSPSSIQVYPLLRGTWQSHTCHIFWRGGEGDAHSGICSCWRRASVFTVLASRARSARGPVQRDHS